MNSEKRLKRITRETIHSVKAIIDQNPFLINGTTEIAGEVGIGRNALQRGFKQLFGTSIKEYKLQQRMVKAKSLLEEGRMSIKQVAYKCGYRSQGNFSAAFKNLYDTTPSAYQNQWEEMILS